MKLKHILNGIAALLTVGMFYTFSFCIVQDVHEEDIASDYSYAEQAVPEAENIIPAVYESADNTSSVLQSGSASISSIAPTGIIIPNAVPDIDELISSSPRLSGEDDEITDENYDENSRLYSGFSDYDLDKLFKEEDNINDYYNASASASVSKSSGEAAKTEKSSNDKSSESSVEKTAAPDSGSITAEDINRGYLEASPAVYAATHSESPASEYNADAETAEPNEPQSDNSPSDPADSSENGISAYTSFDENGSGEILTAKVHGEVQDFDAYELVCMIVANEMSPSFSQEALKAQAVAAYSYVKYHNVNGLTATVLVKEEIPDEIKNAVSSVWGQCCYYNGSVAQTVYTASTSGYTASAQNVWGGDPVPYLQSRKCSFDKDYDPNYGIDKTYSESDIKARLEKYLGITLSDNPENWLVVTEYQDGNYAGTISVDGQTEISGSDLREKILSYGIKSAAFKVSYSNGEFTFTTYGYGHGVGMSQNGANILANQGYSYIDILKFYYEGITIA